MIHRMRPRTPSAIRCDRFDSVFVSLHGTFLPVTLSRRLDLENYIINCVSRQSRVHFNACDTGLCAFFLPFSQSNSIAHKSSRVDTHALNALRCVNREQ